MKLENIDYDEQDEEEKEEKYSSKLNDQVEPSCSKSSISNNQNKNSELCPICLSSILSQTLARPAACQHFFCLECIQEWSKVSLV